jgi:ATP-dependent Zn protease
VIVIAATNFGDKLDPALVRRFSRTIDVELPTLDEREQYLKLRLLAKAQHRVTDGAIRRIAVQSTGRSIANLESILAEASIRSLALQGVLDDDVLFETFERMTLGDAKPGTDLERTARHEAGHALLMCLAGEAPIYVTIVGRGNFGGYAAFDASEDRRALTRLQMETRICQCLGGRAAELLYYGPGEGESTGPSGDLDQATRLAQAMVDQFGMSDEIGAVRIDERLSLAHGLAERRHVAVRRIIDEQAIRAHELLMTHRASLDRIANALHERNRLLQRELLAMVPEAAPQVRTIPRA